METHQGECGSSTDVGNSSGRRRSVVMELPLGDANVGATFDLEKAVCSHGLFMMAPNRWDSVSKTFQRPLRLDSDSLVSHVVRISQPSSSVNGAPARYLRLRVFDTDALSPQQQQSLMEQVRRMLRLSPEEERKVRGFWEVYGKAKKSGFGRVFRSPTLFEDMVKCILLCNCRWAQTLSMARSLCELQLELQCPAVSSRALMAEGLNSGNPIHDENKNFAPKTPSGKDLKRKIGVALEHSSKIHACQTGKEGDAAAVVMVDSADHPSKCLRQSHKRTRCSLFSSKEEQCCSKQGDSCLQASTKKHAVATEPVSVSQASEMTEVMYISYGDIGNFPCPRELVGLTAGFLQKRCGLGYRASRILKLARSIVRGRIQLRQLEEDCGGSASLSNYSKLAEQMKKIHGFGPFACANVLMCMGYYHVIPADSETIRHLQQVHGKRSTIRDIQVDVETIYGHYAPFQFLVYWSEIWSFYEERFGRLSKLRPSDYKLITGSYNIIERHEEAPSPPPRGLISKSD